ncbi:hypothetical protein GQ457_06G037830 [Hibiscus cannabinus]
MEKSQEKTQRNQYQERNHLVWDCGSTLYDSFELNTFNRQLDSAIHSRTMSMPHLLHADPPASKKLPQSSKPSRSIQKLLKSMFKFRQTCSSSSVLLPKHKSNKEHVVAYNKTGALTMIKPYFDPIVSF